MKTPFIAVLSFWLLVATAAMAQSNNPYSKVTPWGDPDISGMWSYASLTPLQRPERLGEKEFYKRMKLINNYLSGSERFLIYETASCFNDHGASIVEKAMNGGSNV